jgi:hypothetical protein
MNSLIIDLFLCGVAYVILIYFVATMTKNSLRKGNSSNDDGDGGIENFTPPKIDLPPGVIWPNDVTKKTKSSDTVEY